MLGTYNHKFDLPNGHRVFVPSAASRKAGATVRAGVGHRWRPPYYFYHFRAGGHVAALKVHLHHRWFATIDISGFFDSVTRTKIHRALLRIGFSHEEAWEIAQESTVEKNVRCRDFSLPYGFVQSPVLASLALDRSALGQALVPLARSNHTRLTCYVDDVVLSGLEEEVVENAPLALIQAAEQSAFAINTKKSQVPGPEITAFNIILSHESIVVAEDRMVEFEGVISLADNPFVVTGVIAYVQSANASQVPRLVQVGLASANQDVQSAAAAFV
jgi:Reverse transcriptase (RNA-dependent DNA polymerase)